MSQHRQAQELRLATNPKQLQLLSLLQTPQALLEQRLKTELEKNVMLEYAPDSVNSASTEYLPSADISPNSDYEEDSTEKYHSSDSNLYNLYDWRLLSIRDNKSGRELLQEQLLGLNLDEESRVVAEFLIESLEDNGLLVKPLLTLSHDLEARYELSLSREKLYSIIEIIQSLDPPGIGARSVAEALILQLKRLNPQPKLALTIIQEHYTDFLHNNLAKLARKLAVSSEEIQQAQQLIATLRPYPFLPRAENPNPQGSKQLLPDFILHRDQNTLILQSQQSPNTSLCINDYYAKMLENYKSQKDTAHKEAYLYLKDKHKQAEDLLDNLRNRQKLLFSATQTIIERQKDFFLSGDYAKLKVLTLKDLAEPLDLEISTLSRIVQGKYIATEFGTIALRDCFLRAHNNKEGKEFNPTIISEYIEQIIGSETRENPYSDEQIQQILAEKYNTKLARRTIAKYRKNLNIPTKDLRTQSK